MQRGQLGLVGCQCAHGAVMYAYSADFLILKCQQPCEGHKHHSSQAQVQANTYKHTLIKSSRVISFLATESARSLFT